MPRHNPQDERDDLPEAGGLSLDLLYRRHYSWLLRVVRWRFGRDQAEDLVQETYLRAAAYQGREVRNPRGLLVQIAIRAAFERERRRLARPPLHDVSADEVRTESEQSETLALKQAILSLPGPLRDVFVLSRFAGLTYEEIAVRTGISVKAVEARMTKALKLCSASLRNGRF